MNPGLDERRNNLRQVSVVIKVRLDAQSHFPPEVFQMLLRQLVGEAFRVKLFFAFPNGVEYGCANFRMVV